MHRTNRALRCRRGKGRWRFPADTGAPATTSDALRRLAALGRTRSDRELLGHALGKLDAQDRLASKIAAEPNLAAIMTEFVTRLLDAFGSLSAVRGQAVLDIACGSSSSRSPVTGRQTAEFEPWMCRLLLELGARPVGVDIGDLDENLSQGGRFDLPERVHKVLFFDRETGNQLVRDLVLCEVYIR